MIELLVVIMIIAILAAILFGLPSAQGAQEHVPEQPEADGDGCHAVRAGL